MARTFAAGGGLVLGGRCTRDMGLAYQALADAFRPVLDEVDLAVIEKAAGPVARLLPIAFPRLGPLAATSSGPDNREQWAVAVGAMGDHALGDSAALLVLDDVQWAPPATLDLVTAAWLPRPVLLTQRTGDAATSTAAAIDRLVTTGRLGVIDVDGLTARGMAALVAYRDEALATDDVVDEVHRRSAGNPLFAEELISHLIERGTAEGTPHSLQDVVLRRVADVGDAAPRILGAAAVLGAPFDAGLVAGVSGDGDDVVADVVTGAAARGLLVENEDGSFDFKHALTRDAMYESLSKARRHRLHGRAATAFKPRSPERYAFHLAMGATTATLDDLAPAALAAADAGGPYWAYDSREILDRAIDALEIDGRPRADRARLWLETGVTAYFQGDMDDVVRRSRLAAFEARRAGDIAQYAAAVKHWGMAFGDDRGAGAIPLAEEALALGAGNDEAVHDAAVILATHYSWTGNDAARAIELGRLAYETAQRLGDGDRMGSGLAVWMQALAGTPDIELRLRLAKQYLDVDRRGSAEPLSSGYALCAGALLTAGDRDGFDALCAHAEDLVSKGAWWLAEQLTYALRGCRALLDGDMNTAMAMAASQMRTTPHVGIRPAVGQFGLALRELGRTADLVPFVRALPAESTTGRLAPTLLMLALAELGEVDEARALLGEAQVDDNMAKAVTLALTAEAVALLGAADEARALIDQLSPYAGQVIVVPLCSAALGAADHFLGLLAATAGDGAAARRHLDRALELHDAIRAPLLVQHTRAALAQLVDEA